MAKIIHVCARNGMLPSVAERLRSICKRLEPDNIIPPAPRIAVSGNVAYGVMNPPASMLHKGGSVALGQFFEDEYVSLEEPGTQPDGCFALFRDGEDQLEIVMDPAGSRTIWYYVDDTVFVSSTSQRAIVTLLGSFEFDERVIPWVLSTGTLGPALSWDRRIRPVPPDSSVVLDKRTWTVSKRSNPVEFVPRKRPRSEHRRSLQESLEAVFGSLGIDLSKWALALSGGLDSRAILYLFRDSGQDLGKLRTVTWGRLESARVCKGNDACIARQVADAVGVSNTYYWFSDRPAQEIVDRFVALGEGRTDHVYGYVDGFATWKALFEDEVQGIIRGDQGLGTRRIELPLNSEVRHRGRCPLYLDFRDLRHLLGDYGMVASQELPQHLLRGGSETLATWRDRLHHLFVIPVILSALSDLKLAYLEVVNPLLSRRVLQCARELPDRLRTEKALFREVVASMSPRFGLADDRAIVRPGTLLGEKGMLSLLSEEVGSQGAKSLFPAEFLQSLSKNMERELTTPRHPLLLKLENAVLGRAVGPRRLSFRVMLICRMKRLLCDDAGALGAWNPDDCHR